MTAESSTPCLPPLDRPPSALLSLWPSALLSLWLSALPFLAIRHRRSSPSGHPPPVLLSLWPSAVPSLVIHRRRSSSSGRTPSLLWPSVVPLSDPPSRSTPAADCRLCLSSQLRLPSTSTSQPGRPTTSTDGIAPAMQAHRRRLRLSPFSDDGIVVVLLFFLLCSTTGFTNPDCVCIYCAAIFLALFY